MIDQLLVENELQYYRVNKLKMYALRSKIKELDFKLKKKLKELKNYYNVLG